MNRNKMVRDSKYRSRPYYFRRCKKERLTTTSIDSLPDELLCLILVCLPADYLHDRARLVCRRWYDIIHSQSFINQHFENSANCLLLFYNYSGGLPSWMMTATSQGLIQRNEFSYKFREKFFGTCNGLMLELVSRENNIIILQIINPATKQALLLPPFTSPVGTPMYPNCGIAYAAASMKYKVAISYITSSSSSPPLSACLAILSVGVDNSWRQVQVDQYLSKQNLSWAIPNIGAPFITEGLMHWWRQSFGNIIVTLDVETEILTVSHNPCPSQNYLNISKLNFFLSTGRSISLLIGQCGLSNEGMRLFELWEMNPETKEWIMLVDEIKLGDQQQQLRLQQLGIRPREAIRPRGWVKYPELLVFTVNDYTKCGTVISYNLGTHEINLIKFPRSLHYTAETMYKNSLLWLT